MSVQQAKSPPSFSLCFAVGGGMLAWGVSAKGEIDLERRIITQPVTHARIVSGTPSAVHWARLQSHMLNDDQNASLLAEDHRHVSDCPSGGSLGFKSDPPRQWPNRMEGIGEDHYATANYSIAYHYGGGYGFVGVTCGLRESQVARPTLRSSAGQCVIDLDKRTASGVCDFERHRHVAPTNRFVIPPGTPVPAPLLGMKNRCEPIVRGHRAHES